MFTAEDYRCDKCNHVWDLIVRRDNRDELQVCPACEVLAGRRSIITPRGLIQKALRPMGTDSKYKAGAKLLQESAALKEEMYDKPVSERGELVKEINKLESI
jgi:hypothetical protein